MPFRYSALTRRSWIYQPPYYTHNLLSDFSISFAFAAIIGFVVEIFGFRLVGFRPSYVVPWSEVRVMLHLVAPYVAEMLHLKTLTINRVAGVAGFQTISTCKIHIKSFIINVVAGVFDGFLILPYRQPTRPTATNGRPNPAFGGKPAKSSPIKPNQGESRSQFFSNQRSTR